MYSGHAITKGMYPLSFCFEHKYVRFYTGHISDGIFK